MANEQALRELIAKLRNIKATLYLPNKHEYNGYATACGDCANALEAALIKPVPPTEPPMIIQEEGQLLTGFKPVAAAPLDQAGTLETLKRELWRMFEDGHVQYSKIIELLERASQAASGAQPQVCTKCERSTETAFHQVQLCNDCFSHFLLATSASLREEQVRKFVHHDGACDYMRGEQEQSCSCGALAFKNMLLKSGQP